MKNNTTKTLALNGLLMAIILLMAFVPFIGFIQIGPIAITLAHIPVIVGAILFGLKTGFILSLTFGISSMLVAITRGAIVADLAFINPMVSILPRLIFGLVIHFIYRFSSNIKSENLRIGLTALLSTLIHSFVTLSALLISLNLEGDAIVLQILKAFLVINVISEAVVATLVCIPVVRILRKGLKL